MWCRVVQVCIAFLVVSSLLVSSQLDGDCIKQCERRYRQCLRKPTYYQSKMDRNKSCTHLRLVCVNNCIREEERLADVKKRKAEEKKRKQNKHKRKNKCPRNRVSKDRGEWIQTYYTSCHQLFIWVKFHWDTRLGRCLNWQHTLGLVDI